MGVRQRWQEYVAQYGFTGLLRHLAARIVSPVWESTATDILVLESPAADVRAKAPVQIEVLSEAAARQNDLSNPEWEKRWLRGDVCYAAWLDGRLVHHSWVDRGDSYIGEVRAWLRLPANEAYIYDCYTDGNCRGLGIFPAVLSHVSQELFAQGIRRIWIAVEESNRSSLRAIVRNGFKLAGVVLYRRVAGRTRREVRPLAESPGFRVE